MVKLIRHENIQTNTRFFCENSSIRGLNFLAMENISSFERKIWALINVCIVIGTAFFMKYLWQTYVNAATIVTLESSNYHVEKIPYPGISICNLNKISKQKAHDLAEELNNKLMREEFKTHNISATLEKIRILGNLYDFNTYGQDQFAQIDYIINEYQQEHPSISLLKLAPSCDDILVDCNWGGKKYPCEELFLTRMTFEGPCCVFNYVRPSILKSLWNNSREVPRNPEYAQGPGREDGLEVTLNNRLDDYFYTTSDTIGFIVHIFDSTEFPDLQSGSLMEVVVSPGMFGAISLEFDVIQSTPGMKTLPINLRKCKFEEDETTIFGPYRQSDCFVDCRIKSMVALCDCVPLTMPAGPAVNARYCTLSDISCMNKHKAKWSRYYPYDTDVTGLKQELNDALNCSTCLPNCNSINYNVHTNFASLFPSESGEINVTLVSVYPNRPFGNIYKIDLTNTWFEILSSFGGILSLLMGLSVISVIEIFVFLCRITFKYICDFRNKNK